MNVSLRVSPAALLIVTAFAAAVTVELRTLLGFFGLEVSVGTTAAIGALAIVAVWVWALLPSSDLETGSDGGSGGSHQRAD